MAIKKVGTFDMTPSTSGMFRNALLMLESLRSDVPKNKSNYINYGIKGTIQIMLEVGLKQTRKIKELEEEIIKQEKFINTLKGGSK
jgi:hypothetical protein